MKLRRFAALFSSIVENKIKLESGGHRGTMESRSLTPYTWPENYGVPWNNYKSLSRDMISFPVLIKRNNETWMRRRGHKSGFLSIIGYIVWISCLWEYSANRVFSIVFSFGTVPTFFFFSFSFSINEDCFTRIWQSCNGLLPYAGNEFFVKFFSLSMRREVLGEL